MPCACMAEIHLCSQSSWVTLLCQNLLGMVGMGHGLGSVWEWGERAQRRELLRVHLGEVLSPGCAGAADRTHT